MKNLEIKQINWVGFKKIRCPNCDKYIYLDTIKIIQNNLEKCIHCKSGFLIKII